jgi:proline iminopeptidase
MTMVPIRDVSLFVKVMGHGDPLVLMHGGPGLDHTTLSSLEALADQFTLIFYDHRANGRSTGAAESPTWEISPPMRTRCVSHWLRSVGSARPFLRRTGAGVRATIFERVSQLLFFDTCGEAHWYAESAPELLRKRGYSAATAAAARALHWGYPSG